MKIRISITIPKKAKKLLSSLRKYGFSLLDNNSPYRVRLLSALLVLLIITFFLRIYVLQIVARKFNPNTQKPTNLNSEILPESFEKSIIKQSNSDVKGITTFKRKEYEIESDVGFIDLRVLTLEDLFRFYESPLLDYSDEFIEASEEYGMTNWQLLPAIAMAETIGCQTGISHEQRNCWGWGGSGSNRWEFYSYEDAIDLITRKMVNGYGNDRLNARDIQSTYCGITCMEWGWRWASGVNYYTKKINEFGDKYGLAHTNEITDWTWDENQYLSRSMTRSRD